MGIYSCISICCFIICLTVIIVNKINKNKPRANRGCENYKEKIEQGYDPI